MNKKVVAGIGLIVGAILIALGIKSIKKPCTEGATKCVGPDLYACVNGKWELQERNSPACVLPPSCSVDADCPEGYVCENGVCIPASGGELPGVFYVETITAEPSVVVLGNEVKIHVEYQVPDGMDCRPYIGKTYQARCTIDGETLTISVGPIPYFPVDAYFAYIPQSIGTYTAAVLDKAVSFEVREKVLGPFYSPYGTVCGFVPLGFGATTCQDGYTPYNTLDALADTLASSAWIEYGGIWTSESAPGAGVMREYTKCPYCSATFTACIRSKGLSCTHGQRIGAAYDLLDHIGSSHPEYPLTKPRPHVEVTVPQLPSPVTGVWMSPQAYRVKIDGNSYVMQYDCAYSTYLGPCNTWVFNNVRLFATMPGRHHVEVRGPCGTAYAIMRPELCGEVIFSQDVTLQAVGDKVTIDVETGLMGYKKGMTPTG